MPSEGIKVGTWSDWWAYVALRCVVCLIQSLSLETCDYYCRVVARILSDWTWLRQRVTDENLELVYGPLSPGHKSLLRRKMWHHLMLMVCEIAQGPRKIHRTNYCEHFYMPDKAVVLKMMMADRPSVLVTGHFGNFEVAGHTVGLLGTPTSTIARPLDNAFIDRYVSEFRSLSGQHMLPKEGSASAVQDLLANGGSLTLLADQYAGAKGAWVDFFGHPTSCHKALALFVLSAKAPMIVNYTRRLDRPLRFEMGITGIADPALLDTVPVPEYLESVNSLTEWYNARLEEAIRMAPEQYWWLHRRWRGIPPVQQRKLKQRQESQQSKQLLS